MHYMFAIFHERHMKAYLTALDSIDCVTLAYHTVARIDHFIAAITKSQDLTLRQMQLLRRVHQATSSLILTKSPLDTWLTTSKTSPKSPMVKQN